MKKENGEIVPPYIVGQENGYIKKGSTIVSVPNDVGFSIRGKVVLSGEEGAIGIEQLTPQNEPLGFGMLEEGTKVNIEGEKPKTS